MARKDNFWKIFFSVIGGMTLVLVMGITSLKVSYFKQPDDASLAAAVGVTFDPLQDPFEKNQKLVETTGLASDYLFRDSLPLGSEDWSWDTGVNWRSNERAYEGGYSLKADYAAPWAGVRLSSPQMSVSRYQSLSLAVYPDSKVEDLYVDVYDTFGRSAGEQSLGWYTQSGTLTPDAWNRVTIPLANLIAPSTEKITGFSISTKKPGAAFIDAVRLETSAVTHERWENTGEEAGVWVGQDPFTGIAQATLPYSLVTTSADNLALWRPLFGQFEKTDGGVHIGPEPKKTNGSMTVFGGGKEWENYRVDASVYWGMTSTFSLLMRFTDDANFAACAYSNYGAVVQIYAVKKGASTMVAQSPLLAIRAYEPWKDAQHSATVSGNRISCYMDGEKVLSATLPDMPVQGTAGIETWSINSDDYPHVLKELNVTAY